MVFGKCINGALVQIPLHIITQKTNLYDKVFTQHKVIMHYIHLTFRKCIQTVQKNRESPI